MIWFSLEIKVLLNSYEVHFEKNFDFDEVQAIGFI
jgi:hypothetical protein